jgi:NADH-quinone oxidoreductase subunit N
MAIVDRYAVFFNAVFLVAALGCLLLSHEYLERVGVRVPEYYALLLFGALGMTLLAVANDLILLFLAIEIMSIAMYVLCAINRGVEKSLEAGFKYFILGAFSSAILLYGIAMVYGAAGTTRFDYIGAWFEAGHSVHESPIMAAGLAMLLVGLGFKVAAGAFPRVEPGRVRRRPDAHHGVHVDGREGSVVRGDGSLPLRRACRTPSTTGRGTLWGMAALDDPGRQHRGARQTDFKRCSPTARSRTPGYLLMAFVALPEGGSIEDNPRISGLLFYSVAYTIMSVGAFAVVSLMVRRGADDTRLDRLAGLASRSPWVAAGLAVCLCPCGHPADRGFVGKFYLFASADRRRLAGHRGRRGDRWRHRRLLLPAADRADVHAPAGDDPWIPADSPVATGTLVACVTLILLLGLYPSPLVDWARESIDVASAGGVGSLTAAERQPYASESRRAGVTLCTGGPTRERLWRSPMCWAGGRVLEASRWRGGDGNEHVR